ncbi:DUF3089 domain-containing protein [Flavisphingomonas formosensis]|uniref:DUF3089 domain-containing protein n=1 Tax=Flavisphingomonas formosensis TaxID=861534 RepID=UPI0012FA6317|nr:DUF3089 domain-containing protein [Sphingomonas formosensis]
MVSIDRIRVLLLLVLISLWPALAAAQTAAAEPPAPTPVDYGAPASWLCRPGSEGPCTDGLDAMIVSGEGTRRREAFVPAADPPIDCFYVYPTASREQGSYADMTPSPELVRVARAQAGRLASRCRLFVPLYRQVTLAALFKRLAGDPATDKSLPYRDVLDAWTWYLAHDNHGRGVVLIGHSQGTILLQHLIAAEIDGKPAQKRIVSIMLAGDPGLLVPDHATIGGTFKHIPLCAGADQTGCVYTWSSYAADDTSPTRAFGRNRRAGLVAACVNPAAPGGGDGMLEAYLPKPKMAPDDDPPWVKVVGQLSARCVSDADGNVLSISVQDTPFAGLLHEVLQRTSAMPGWGLHRLDINLAQGNMLDLIDAETRTWAKH